MKFHKAFLLGFSCCVGVLLSGMAYGVEAEYLEPNIYSEEDTEGWSMEVVNCNEWVSLRQEPDVNSYRLKKIPLGAEVSNCQWYSDEFVFCEYDGAWGFVLSEYLSYIEPSYEYDEYGEYSGYEEYEVNEDIWQEHSSFVSAVMNFEPLFTGGEVILDEKVGDCRIVAVRGLWADEVLRVCGYNEDLEPIWGYVTYVDYRTELNATDAFLAGPDWEPSLVISNADIGLVMVDAYTGERIWYLDTDSLPLGGGLVHASDQYGNLYLTGYYTNELICVSMAGQVLWQEEPENPDVYWPYQIRLEAGCAVVDDDSGYESGHFVIAYSMEDGKKEWMDIL